MTNRLYLKNLQKIYGEKTVLTDVNLNLDRPGIWALIGPNGSGKTTLMDCIAYLQAPSSGTIKILEKSNKDEKFYHLFSYVQDQRILYPELSGIDHLQFMQRALHVSKSRVQEVIEFTGIKDYVKQRVRTYSLGMKQHLLIAIGILNEPKVLLLDEPFNGLDPTSVLKIRHLLLEMAKKDTTILVSSHQLAEMDQLTNQFIFLKDGKLIEKHLNNKETLYRIHTSSDEKVLESLSQSFSITKDREGLLVNLQDDAFDFVIRKILECKVIIFSIESIKYQAEVLYQEFFDKG